MKKYITHIILFLVLVLTIANFIFWYSTKEETRILTRAIGEGATLNLVYNDTDGALQVVQAGRGVTTPQSGNLSPSAIYNSVYDSTLGALQFKVNEPLDLSYLNLSSTSPYLKMHNTTHEDISGGRESLIYALGEQSGGEISRLAEIEMSHSGTGDDQKGKIIFKVNDGNDGDLPSQIIQFQSNQILVPNGSAAVPGYAFTGEPDIGLYKVGTNELGFATNGAFAGKVLDGGDWIFGTDAAGRARIYNRSNDLNNVTYGFAGDAGTGLNRQAANTLAFVTGAIRRVVINSTGDMSIQTGGLVPASKGSDPCGSLPTGAIFWNMSSYYPCYCDNGGNDLKISDNLACF